MGAVGVVVEEDGGAGFGGQQGVQEAGHPEAAIDQHQIGFYGAVLQGGVHVVAEAVAVGAGIAPVAHSPRSIASIVIRRSAWSAVASRTFAIQASEESTARMRALLWWATQIVELPQPYSP